MPKILFLISVPFFRYVLLQVDPSGTVSSATASYAHLDNRIRDLEADNYQLRMRLQEDDGRRSAREVELKQICVEQAKEIEDLHMQLSRACSMEAPSHAYASSSVTIPPWLGVEVATSQVSEAKRQAMLQTHSQGAVRITGLSAQAVKAGLKVGDLITWVNTSHRTLDSTDFYNALGKVQNGDMATLMIRRGRQEKEIRLELDI